MQGPVSASICRTKWASRLTPSPSATSDELSSVAMIDPASEASSLPSPADDSVSDRFKPVHPRPLCLFDVRRNAFSRSALFLPCTLASFAKVFNSPSFSSEDASSRLVIAPTDVSAKVKEDSSDASSSRGSEYGMWFSGSDEASGKGRLLCSSLIAPFRSLISPLYPKPLIRCHAAVLRKKRRTYLAFY